MLIAVIACVNFWLYWVQGSRLTLVFAIVCSACVVGWLVVANRIVKK